MPVKWIWFLSCSWTALIAAGGCAVRSVSHTAPDESRPHLTWDIRTGGEDGNDRLVCASSTPTRSCILPAGTKENPGRATVHVYLHPAARTTNYLGTMKAAFLQGSSVLSGYDVSGTVEPGSQPLSVTVNGLVIAEPGNYEFRVAVDAIEEGSTTPQRIVDQATVTVK